MNQEMRKINTINSGLVHGFPNSRHYGFTLIELMVALVLSLFLIGGAILISTSGKATYTDAEKLSRAQESIRFASDFLIRDIRNAGFRDRVSLKVGHEDQIREQYAEVSGDGRVLTIRYAGRGHCTQNFETFRLVENEYSIADGELRCTGRSVATTEPGDTDVGAQPPTAAIGLISGVSDVQFDLICPAGVASCTCDISTAPDQACLGVRVGIQFEAVRDLDNPGAFEQRFVELVATFRNIGVFRIFENVI